MKTRILLIGKSGQIGSELAVRLPQLAEVIALDRADLDLAKMADIREAIQKVRPRFIVNAAAYTAVDQAEKEEGIARRINSDAPGTMAEEAEKIGATLIHYSTDYVFDGGKASPYSESDPPRPLNVYGDTKLSGEDAIRNSGAFHLILRTSWVYATRGRNFLLTILRLATQHDELRVVCDQVGSPTWSREIAGATAHIMGQLIEQQEKSPSASAPKGIVHMTASGQTNWCEFAKAILEEASVTPRSPWLTSVTGGNPLRRSHVVPITTEEYPTPARRPRYSVLSNDLLAKSFKLELRDWRVQLQHAFREV